MIKEYRNYSLLAHNTFGIDAKCKRFLEYSSVEDAQEIARMLTPDDQPILIVGGGSNLLLTQDYPGTVIHSTIKGIEVVSETAKNTSDDSSDGKVRVSGDSSKGDSVFLRCGSGEVFDDVVAYAVEHGLHGAENLSIIPGDVGACAVQNIGAYGVEAKDIIVKVEAVEIATGMVVVFDNADCDYSYRQSKFKHEWRDKYLMTHVTFRLSREFAPDLDYGNIRKSLADKNISHPTAAQLREAIIEIRNSKLPDPKVLGNAGSFFMNPIIDRATFESLETRFPGIPHYDVDADRVKVPAGWMIDQCGWKGKSLGRAGVHDKQALVLVNRGGATGKEIVLLCDAIRKDVADKFGIDIQPEVNII